MGLIRIQWPIFQYWTELDQNPNVILQIIQYKLSAKEKINIFLYLTEVCSGLILGNLQFTEFNGGQRAGGRGVRG